VTAFLAVYDPDGRTLRYASAGHPPALLRPAEGGSRPLDGDPGIPLGVLRDAEYRDHGLRVERGQSLLLYTDGITEARAPDGRFFGLAGLERAFDASGTSSPAGVVEHVVAAVRRHEAGGQPGDDRTLLALRVE
jgi:serine phosphatase RsbU (regulator of sigma subunit)